MAKMGRVLLLILFVAGLAAAAGKMFVWGDAATRYGAYVPWGLWIAIYISLVGATAGCAAVAAWLDLQESDSGPLMPAALLSGAVLLAFGLLFVGIDLGKPWQGFRIFLHPSFSSPLAWASWLYIAFFAGVAAYFLTGLQRAAKGLAVLAAIGFTVAEGVFFGQMVARPLWNTALTVVLFLLFALSAGSALLLLVGKGSGLKISDALTEKLQKVLLWAVIAYAAVEAADVAMAMNGAPEKAAAAKRMASSYGFWLLYGVVGTLAPIVLLWRKQKQCWSAAMVLIGAVGSKYAFVRYGFWPEPMPGLARAFQDAGLQIRYFPSVVEWVAGIGLLAGAVWLTLWVIEKFVVPKTAQ